MGHTQDINAEKRERSFIKIRNASLLVLALGTALASMSISNAISNEYHFNLFFKIVFQIVFVVLGYISIDSALRNNLLVSSQGEDKGLKRYFERGALIALLFTVLFSLGASWIVGQFSKGESNYKDYNKQIDVYSKRDSTNKALASQTLIKLNKEEENQISLAKDKARALENAIVARGSISWQNDYKNAKNNPSHWLWVCTGKQSGCPKEYRKWRDEILQAREEGKQLIASVTNTNLDIKKSISNSLSYNIGKDTTLIKYQSNIEQLESERNQKGYLTTLFLILITFVSAFGAWNANRSINKIRSVYGQQVQEADEIFFDVLEDFVLKITAQLLSVLYGFLIIIDKTLEKINIDLYEIKKQPIAKIYKSLKGVTNKDVAPNLQPVNYESLQNPREFKALAKHVVRNELEKRETPTLSDEEKGVVTVAENARNSVTTSVAADNTENTTIVANNHFHGMPTTIWRGKKRSLDWMEKNLGANKSRYKLYKREGKETTNVETTIMMFEERIREMKEEWEIKKNN